MTESERPIFLDYAAGTPTDPRVADKMAGCLTADGLFANPASSTHVFGRRAKGAVEDARGQVAGLVGASHEEIIWTSGATESDNLAITGGARFRRDRGRHIVTSKIEHKAVLDTCRQLEKEGFELTYLRPLAGGMIDPQQRADALPAAGPNLHRLRRQRRCCSDQRRRRRGGVEKQRDEEPLRHFRPP